MKIDVVTLFPEWLETLTQYGVVGRALQKEQVKLGLINPRDYTEDAHRTVDDRPYGGGPGMVMKYQPLEAAIEQAKSQSSAAKVVLLTPQGKVLDQCGVRRLAEAQHLVLVCGRYEGVDERVIETHIDEEVSIGDYVLSGGELGAMVLIDAIARTLPGVLGDEESAVLESFENDLLDYPQYTRPERLPEASDSLAVPEVLLSGDHARIERWRLKQCLGRTYLRRPDLLEKRVLSVDEKELLKEFLEEHIVENE